MASRAYVFNVTKQCYVRYSRALKSMKEACATTWVEEGVSIRDLTLAESIIARNEQARIREPLADEEIRGLQFTPPTNGAQAYRDSKRLAWDANQFALDSQIAA